MPELPPPDTHAPRSMDAPWGPPAHVGTHLWFAWGMVWAALMTVPSSIAQLIGHQRSPTARNFKRWSSLWARAILRGIGIRVELTERVRLDAAQPYVFACNHQSMLDILVLAAALPYPFGFVAKASLERVPFLGFAIRHSASLFIDRSEPRRMIETMRRAGERIREGNSVLVFPEGQRSYAPTLLPFMRGAFALATEAGVPLVPVTIVDAYRLMDERVKTLRPGTVRVVVGEPIAMAGVRRRDLPGVIAAVQAQMEAELAEELRATPAVESAPV